MIAFTEDHTVGVRAVDNQHKELINLYNKLETMVDKSKSCTVNLSYFIKELFDYTIDNFRVEESIMQVLKYPLFVEHKKQHKTLLERLDELSINMENNDVEIQKLLNFVKDFLDKHIMLDDKDLGLFIKNKNKQEVVL